MGFAGEMDVLHREILLMLICPVLAWLAAPWTTCEKGSPSWLYAVYLPILARSKWIEWRLMLDFTNHSGSFYYLFLSMLLVNE